MSKSLGNYIGIRESPLDQYSKVMSIGDELMREYFLLCTDVPEAEFTALIATAKNPMEVKHRLAAEIVTIYHGAEAGRQAGEEWRRIHSKGEFPADAPEVTVAENPIGIVALIRLCGFAPSNGEARRLVEQGGVSLNGQKIGDPAAQVEIADGAEFKVGKKNHARLKL